MAPPNAFDRIMGTKQKTFAKKKTGPVPTGKVWDPFRGYVDDPNAQPKLIAAPAHRPPTGTKWDGKGNFVYVEGHERAWQQYDPKYKKLDSSTRTAPAHRPPKGTVWNSETNCYVYVDGHERAGQQYDRNYKKPDSSTRTAPLGRRPDDTVWNSEMNCYVYVDGHERAGQRQLVKKRQKVAPHH